MDLPLYFRVLSRFRYLVVFGLILAVGLTFLSLYRVNLNGKPWVSYRQQETYQATSTFLLTRRGFPLGNTSVGSGSGAGFSSLAVLYAQLVNSDVVRAIVLRQGPLRWKYTAAAVEDPNLGALPVLAVTGLAPTPRRASRIATRVSRAFVTYLKAEQRAARIPVGQRVLVQNISQPVRPTLAKRRRLTLPTVIFLSVLIMTLGLVFILENLRPQVRAPVRELVQAPERVGSQDGQAAASARGTEARQSRA